MFTFFSFFFFPAECTLFWSGWGKSDSGQIINNMALRERKLRRQANPKVARASTTSSSKAGIFDQLIPRG